jgi:hypothetical protein
VPDGGSGRKETRSGGAFSRGVRAATARWTSRARKALGDAPRPCGRGPDNLPHTRHDELRPMRTWPWFVQPGENACYESRVSPPATAAPSPLLLPGWLSGGLRSARSRCPTSSRSALALARVQQTSAPPSAGEQRQRLRHRGGCVTPGAIVKLVAAFVAEQKSADHSGKLLRFLPTESGARTGAGTCSVARAGAPRACLSRADSTTGKQLATVAFWQRRTWTTSDPGPLSEVVPSGTVGADPRFVQAKGTLRLTRSSAGLPASETLGRPNARPSA